MTKVYKDRQSNFTHIKNDIFDSDKYADVNTLSWKAMGIFTYMWHKPDDWEFYEDELASHAKDGKDGLRSGIKELEQAGFLKRDWHRREGKFASYDWILNESPFLDFPKTVKPKSVLPKSDNPKLQSTEGTKDLNNKVRSSGDDSKSSTKPSKAFQTYEQLWGFPNSIAMQDLKQWIDNYSDDLVHYAVEIAGRNNVSSYGSYKYLNKILTEWNKLGIKTVEDAKKQNEQHSQQMDREFKQRKPYGHTPKREELPSWAKPEDELTPEEKAEREKEKNKKPDTKRKKELEDKLKRIRNGEFNHE